MKAGGVSGSVNLLAPFLRIWSKFLDETNIRSDCEPGLPSCSAYIYILTFASFSPFRSNSSRGLHVDTRCNEVVQINQKFLFPLAINNICHRLESENIILMFKF